MIAVDAVVSDTGLRITCSGLYGVGSEAYLSGDLLRDAIKRIMEGRVSPLPEIIIDFTKAEYTWGDGPAWCVLPAALQGVKVTYLISDHIREPFQGLISATNLGRLINVVVVKGA